MATDKRPLKSAVARAKSVIQTKNEPVVGRNNHQRKQLEYKEWLLLRPDERKQVMYNPMLYILLPQMSHEVRLMGKKMHPARP